MSTTARSQIKGVLRKLWLYSKERSEALKQSNYSCECCGVKQSKAKGKEQKLEVHHREGVGNWDLIISLIQQQLLCHTDKLSVLCPECHKKEHYDT